MNELKIEKGIPIPATTETKMPEILKNMEKGDSILLSIKGRTAMAAAAARLGIKVVTRKEGDGFARVWRAE